MDRAAAVAFWLPRDEAMPAFTSNDEFGLQVASSKVVLGYPADAPRMGYLRAVAERWRVPARQTLAGTLAAALARSGYPCAGRDLRRRAPVARVLAPGRASAGPRVG